MESRVERVEATIDRLQGAWPPPIGLRLGRDSSFYELPACFLQAFPAVDGLHAEQLFVFSRLFASTILLQDALLDGDCPPAEIGLATMRLMAMQAEATRILAGLFPPRLRFWDRFYSYLREHARAFVDERRFGRGGALHQLDEESALRLAAGKHATVKIVVAALVELSGAEELLAPLSAAVDGMAVGLQMVDDVEDWESDMRNGRPSFLLARALGDWPGDLDELRSREVRLRVARRVYYGGHAEHVLGLALSALERADEAKAVAPGARFFDRLERIRARCRVKRDTVCEVATEQIARARAAQARV